MSEDSGKAAFELEKACTIIGRSLAYLCLQNTDIMKNGTVLEKAKFLSGLGIAFPDAAKMLGSTRESLRVMAYTKGKKSKGAGRGEKAKNRRRTR